MQFHASFRGMLTLKEVSCHVRNQTVLRVQTSLLVRPEDIYLFALTNPQPFPYTDKGIVWKAKNSNNHVRVETPEVEM